MPFDDDAPRPTANSSATDAGRAWPDATQSVEVAFARDRSTARYYDSRAGEYDEWYWGTGGFAQKRRPGWDTDIAGLIDRITGLEPRRTLDIACGTGFLTRYLPGVVFGLDQSAAMARSAARRVGVGRVVVGDALLLPFGDHCMSRVFTSSFYGHLPADERAAFLAEAFRVAEELVVVDAVRRLGSPPDGWQSRTLNDGSEHRVYKRYFDATSLAVELGGDVLYAGEYFVMARTRKEQ